MSILQDIIFSGLNMSLFLFKKTLIFLFIFSLSSLAIADVVKPALVEISVDKQSHIEIEIRASIEALLSEIDGRFKNTKDSPNAEKYDILRKMQAEDLQLQFDPFKNEFLNKIKLTDNNKQAIKLSITHTKIPEPGYTKVPRISIITLSGKVDLYTDSLKWYYPMVFGDNAVRLRQVDKINEEYHWSEWQWLKKDQTSEALSLTEIVARKPFYKTVINYIVLGFEHILPKGLDHILFILGLFLFSTAVKPLLWQITMFTIAHTITLGLAMNGLVSVPAYIVEPMIALSIAYIGVENMFAKSLLKSRLALVFVFGLLHGLGFASVLAEFGMPDDAFTIALISFNVGVELGQLSIILIAFLLIGYWFDNKPWYKNLITIPASLLISIVAFYWFIQRLDLNLLF